MNLRNNERLVFALSEFKKPSDRTFCQTNWSEAGTLNQNKWGIFWAVNFFNGARKIENLKEFFSWFAEFDDGDKKAQAERISQNLDPSLIVESKNGYHAYYFAEKDQPIDEYKEIMTTQIIPSLGCDKSVFDLARVLRAPNYKHWKNPDDPFQVKVIYYTGHKYSVQDIKKGFVIKTKEGVKQVSDHAEIKKITKDFGSGTLATNVYNLDCVYALKKLSGTEAVNHETFDFKSVSGGKFNIIVNNLSTNCFIDRYGRIGSSNRGGPTVWQWVNWYHNDHKKTYRYIKQYFPELF